MSKTPLRIVLPPYPPPEKTITRADGSLKPTIFVPPQGEMSHETAVLIHQAVCGLFEARRYEDALILSKVICCGRPDYPEAFYNASLALFQLGRISESKSTMQKGPDSLWMGAEANYHMSCIAANLQDWPLALVHAQRATDIDPNHSDAIYQSSLALFHLQRYSEAKSSLQNAPNSFWQQASANYHMACIEVALCSFDLAASYAEKAAKTDPTLLKEMLSDNDLKAIWPRIARICHPGLPATATGGL